MDGTLLIQDFERWLLRRRSASMPPRVNLALVSDDEGRLRQFGVRITAYLNEVDDPDHGGWFLVDDELIEILRHRGFGVQEEGAMGVPDEVFLNGGAVIVSSGRRPELRGPGSDVRVLLTGRENVTEAEEGQEGESRAPDFNRYHAAVNAEMLPGRMVVCLVGDAVLEWSYQLGDAGGADAWRRLQ